MNVQIYKAQQPSSHFIKGAFAVIKPWVTQRHLIGQLVQREVLKRYRGSILGITWSVLSPLVLMLIYTLVFSVVLKMKWSPDKSTFGDFALMLFCGLIPFNFMGEVLGGSTQLIVNSPNYVRRIAFPVEVLPCVQVGSALVHACISMTLLLLGIWFLMGEFHWTFLLLPVIWLPFLIFSLAFSLFLSALGVFIRDVQHLIGLVMSMLFFLTPIFYPADRLANGMSWLLFVNPIAYAVSNIRIVCVGGRFPNWTSWGLFTLCGILLLLIIAGWFQQVRKRFSDVL